MNKSLRKIVSYLLISSILILGTSTHSKAAELIPALSTTNTATQITGNTSSTALIRLKLVQYALGFKGNPYVWGGTSLTRGTDCSGFTQSIFRNYGISIPRTSRTQAVSGKKISLKNMKIGDLVFYGHRGIINHVAIYIGNGKVISASSVKYGIRVTSYNYRQPYKAVTYFR
jgi:Cell wall-associated hydrolases (invasion-associated proteins)